MTVDLRTRYLGLELRSPIVASPSPLTGELDSALQLVAAGAAAIVLPSLFEEEIVHEEIELNRSLEVGADQFAEALDYFPHIASFAGVGNPLRIEPLVDGATVVDIGCGSGTDLLLAAAAIGPHGRAIGVDMTEAMRHKARAAATEAGLANVELRSGDVLDLPIESHSADFVISNGVLNLAPDKRRAFSEVLRILVPGGRFLYADIVVASELPESIRRDIDLWSG